MSFLSRFDERRLLVFDLEGTLIGPQNTGLEHLQRLLQQARDSLVLVYVSGQHVDEHLKALENHNLLVPDYIVTSVGTEIFRMPGASPLDEWQRYIQPGFDREVIAAFIANYGAELDPQPEAAQTPLKISYFLKGASPTRLAEMHRALIRAGFPARIVYSRSLYLDIIPERASIGTAVKYLVDSLVLFPNQVYVCGDSGNDIELFQYGFHGIVVGNASRELREAVELRAYFSHATYAEGILEGLNHYRVFNQAQRTAPPDIAREAFERAVESVRRNITPIGFSAASLADNPLTDNDSNYFAVWSRDGIKTGLWSLCLNDPDITECFRRTLELLAEHQTTSGQIPSNIQILTNYPDYGGLGGIASIDSVLWFVIGCSRYAAYTNDHTFLKRVYPALEKAMYWLRAHDSNNCGLIEIPESSDWMDLFPRSYNVLYDEVLWYQACCDFSVVTAVVGADNQEYWQLAESIPPKILRQFWPTVKRLESRTSFSEAQFSLGDAKYLLAQISPFDFSWRCDVYANILAALMGLLDEHKMEQLFCFLWGVGVNSPYPVQNLYPAIQAGASDWKNYVVTNLLNLPHHYHNGGIWPFIGGLWVRFLAHIGRTELAHQELDRLAEACRAGIYSEWEFNEWLHGQTGRPMGKAHQAWSAAGYIAAYQALHHSAVSPDFEVLTEAMFAEKRREEKPEQPDE